MCVPFQGAPIPSVCISLSHLSHTSWPFVDLYGGVGDGNGGKHPFPAVWPGSVSMVVWTVPENSVSDVLLSNLQSVTSRVSGAGSWGPRLGPRDALCAWAQRGSWRLEFPCALCSEGEGALAGWKQGLLPTVCCHRLWVRRIHLGYEMGDAEIKSSAGGICLSPLQHSSGFTQLHRASFLSMALFERPTCGPWKCVMLLDDDTVGC